MFFEGRKKTLRGIEHRAGALLIVFFDRNLNGCLSIAMAFAYGRCDVLGGSLQGEVRVCVPGG
jgi:hypothetical protein